MRRVRTAKVYRHAHDGAASRRGRGECEVPPLEIGVRAMQLSPYRAGLAGRHGTRLPVPPAFPTCSCPLWLSPSGQSMTQESPFELLLTVSRIQHRVPRRTLSPHPAFQRRRGTLTRPFPFLTAPQWHQGQRPRLCPLWLQGQFRRSFSPPGSPSPCPEHDILAFGSYAASALLPTRWHFHVLFRGKVGEEFPSSRTYDVSRSP